MPRPHRIVSRGDVPAQWDLPGSNSSDGRVKPTKTRPANPYLKGALGVAAMSAARSKNTYLSATYRRIAARRGPLLEIVHPCQSGRSGLV